jgi:REDY-like protein HapK
MAHEIVFLHSLKPGVDVEEYERWVRDIDYPLTKRQPGVLGYVVTRLERPADGADDVPFQYLEVIRVEDPVAYQRNLSESPDEEFKAMLKQWGEYVAGYTGSVGVAV